MGPRQGHDLVRQRGRRFPGLGDGHAGAALVAPRDRHPGRGCWGGAWGWLLRRGVNAFFVWGSGAFPFLAGWWFGARGWLPIHPQEAGVQLFNPKNTPEMLPKSAPWW